MKSVCFISFLIAPTKITLHSTFIAISRQIRNNVTGFWKIPMQTKRYLLNKLPLNFACAYNNTQERSETNTLQKQSQDA
ncbi:hypothetical protein T06_15371 [Trichinella sp. T6]|nr:hypothetical protein T06_15371 [Trichinella sp. T6]